MISRSTLSIFILLTVTIVALPVFAAAGTEESTPASDTTQTDDSATKDAITEPTDTDKKSKTTYLIPELEGASYTVSEGDRQFKNRISFSPAIGKLGTEDLFVFRLGFSPNTWLGYEISLEHNPTSSLHALLHTFNVILRYPLPWRAQPYLTVGYGMITVFPGQAVNADPVSKNTLTAGGGLELYIRDDVAVRGELRSATVLGQELGSEGTVAYSYREYTIGFAFYRSLGR